MDNVTIIHSPFKQKGKGVKVYSGNAKAQFAQKPNEQIVRQEEKVCDCHLCRISKGIGREVRGQFMRYGKV